MKRTSAILNSMFWSLMTALFASAAVQPIVTELEFPTYGFSDPDPGFRPTTGVIVAQRISSIRHCDLILVMEDGRVTGRGTHEELLETCPLYREISESQMGGALLE